LGQTSNTNIHLPDIFTYIQSREKQATVTYIGTNFEYKYTSPENGHDDAAEETTIKYINTKQIHREDRELKIALFENNKDKRNKDKPTTNPELGKSCLLISNSQS